MTVLRVILKHKQALKASAAIEEFCAMFGNLETMGLLAVAVAAIGGAAMTIGTAVAFSRRLGRILPSVVEMVANSVT